MDKALAFEDETHALDDSLAMDNQTLSSDETPAVKKTRAIADNTLSSDGKTDIASQPPYCSNQTCDLWRDGGLCL